MTPGQCHAARALLGWSREQLAQAAPVGLTTIVSFEERSCTPMPRNLLAIQQALEAAGVIFIEQNGDGPGVRLRKLEA